MHYCHALFEDCKEHPTNEKQMQFCPNLLISGMCLSSSSSDFLFFVSRAGTGAVSTSVGPLPGSWLAARNDRSHTRSPGVSVIRVDCRELPLSAIPLCQLLHYDINR